MKNRMKKSVAENIIFADSTYESFEIPKNEL